MPYIDELEDDLGCRPCGCPHDYHLADCPHLAGGGDGPTTKQGWLDRMAVDDGYYDDHPRDEEE